MRDVEERSRPVDLPGKEHYCGGNEQASLSHLTTRGEREDDSQNDSRSEHVGNHERSVNRKRQCHQRDAEVAVAMRHHVGEQSEQAQEQEESEGLWGEIILPRPVEEVEEPDACPPAVPGWPENP